MSELKTNLQEILQEKQEKIIPENIKKDVQIFDVTGTYEGSGSSGEGVKLFETEEEMQADSTAQEGDLAVVYRDEIQNMTVDTQTQYITFPETVVLPEAFVGDAYCMLRAVDESAMFDGQVSLNANRFSFSGFTETGMIRVMYESSDGITYTRQEFTGDSGDLTNPVDLGTSVGIYMAEEWNDSFGYFMQIDKTIFNGLYKYDGVNYNIAANQYTLISSNQLLPDISAYGKNGNITGDGSITNATNSFADIPAMLYSQIQAKYDNMEPRVLTDEDKEIDDNIYIIPTKSDGTVLLDTSQVTNMQSMFSGCSDLTEIPTLNTSNVTNMSYIFSSCSNLTKVSSLDTSNVTNMSCMFSGCSNLIDVPELNTSKVTDMGYMFSYCSNLTEIPIFDMSSVTDAYSMFGHCKSLVAAPELNLSNVTTTFDMFAGCTNLTTVPVFNISKINTPLRMFSDCPNLSNDSLNNILASCVTANSIIDADDKTLKYIGLSETQATTCATLSNWAACESAGWTTGY